MTVEMHSGTIQWSIGPIWNKLQWVLQLEHDINEVQVRCMTSKVFLRASNLLPIKKAFLYMDDFRSAEWLRMNHLLNETVQQI